MKLFKLITLMFVFALGMLVPASMTYADRCGRSDEHANTSHPDNEHNGDHNCPVDTTIAPTTSVDTDVPPTPLPVTGAGTTAIIVAGLAAVSAGTVMLVARKKR